MVCSKRTGLRRRMVTEIYKDIEGSLRRSFFVSKNSAVIPLTTFLGGVSGSLDAFDAIVLQEQEGICVALHPPLRKKILDILFDPGIIQ